MELFEMARIVYLIRGMLLDINAYISSMSNILKHKDDPLYGGLLYQLMLNIKHDIIVDYEEVLHAFYEYDPEDTKNAVPIKRSHIYTKMFGQLRFKMSYLLILLEKIRESIGLSDTASRYHNYNECVNLCDSCIAELKKYREMTTPPKAQKSYGAKVTATYYDDLEFINVMDD